MSPCFACTCSPIRLMAASMPANGAPSNPSELFEAPLFGSLYAPARDGSRFLIAIPAPSTDVVPIEVRVNALKMR